MLCIHSLRRPHALREVVNHLYAMGLRNPSEPTYGVLSCLIGYDQFQSMEVSKFQEYFSFHQSMKSQAQDMLDRLRKLESMTDSIPLVTLPENPEELKDLKVFAQEGPAKARINLDHLNHMANTLPLRKSNKFSGQQNAVPPPGSGPSNLSFGPSMNMLAMAGGLQNGWQSALALAQMLQPQGTRDHSSVDLPNLKLLSPRSQSKALENVRAPVSTNPTAASSSAVGSGNIGQSVAKSDPTAKPMALMDGVVQDTRPDKESAVKIESPPVQEVPEKRPRPTLPALDMVKEALDARADDKKASGMKRPAASEPGPAPKQKAIRDASLQAVATPKAKPKTKATAKAKNVLKKPSANFHGTVSQKERFRWRPEGCPTCRWRKGCTDSCWLKRKLRPI